MLQKQLSCFVCIWLNICRLQKVAEQGYLNNENNVVLFCSIALKFAVTVDFPVLPTNVGINVARTQVLHKHSKHSKSQWYCFYNKQAKHTMFIKKFW